MSTVLQFDSKAALSAEVGTHVLAAAQEAVAEHGKFVIALSGGSLPKLLAQGLLEYSGQIDWSTWHVFFADERYVAAGHADSNLAACQEAFLSDSRVAIPADQVYGLDHSLPLAESAAAYQANLVRVAGGGGEAAAATGASSGPPRFDLVMLGMGPDGHTCSLFPGHALLKETAAWVAPIADSPKPPPERITLTYPVLNAAGKVFFLATGGSKAEVLPRVTCSAADLLVQGEAALPAGRVRPASGKLVWFVDTDAAAKL